MNPFAELSLDNWILRLCERINYQRPTKIQKLAIPSILKGKNVIVNAETGSGKTATFSFPIIQKLAKDPYGLFALILTPNRELAFQIHEQLLVFGTSINLRCCCLVGGMDMLKQSQELSKIPHIIVGTPGRVNDMMNRDFKLRDYIGNLKFLVLDEADRLFEESMLIDLREIIGRLPEERQNILTSATIQEDLKEEFKELVLGKQHKENKFLYFNDNREIQTVSTLSQVYLIL